MATIDNEFDAEYLPAAEPTSTGKKAARLALTLFGPTNPWISVLAAVWGFFDQQAQWNKVSACLTAIHDQMVRLEKKMGQLDSKLQQFASTQEFKNAVYAAIQESARQSNEDKPKQMGTAIANSLIVLGSPEPYEPYITKELESMIRDLAQLNDLDLKALTILREVFFSVLQMLPNLNDDNYFTEKFEQYRKAITDNNIHPDDFYSQCCRLVGFGLAMQVRHNPSRMTLDAHMFRPTRRGIRLLRLLAEDPSKL